MEDQHKQYQELYRLYERLGMLNDVTNNTIVGIARMLKISPKDFAEAMMGGKMNKQYEADVLVEFQKITGRTTDAMDTVVAQELKKSKL